MPFVNRAMLVGACQVGTYDQFRASYRKAGITDPLLNVFAAAMTSGLLYSLITMPLETAKNRMAFQKPDPVTKQLQYRTTVQTLTSIAKNEGVLTLWRGFPPYYLRCGGHTVTMFVFVEELRKMYYKFVDTKL
jgi:solute carrier family 25 oxoglutarate transporter 11